MLFTIVKVMGAGYLIFLGIQAIHHRKDATQAIVADKVQRSGWRLLGEGFVVGVTNPKSIAFSVAISPQFVDPQAGSVPEQLLVLGVIVVAIGVRCDLLWGFLASAARDWFGRPPQRIEARGSTGGALMIGLGAFLLVWSEKRATA